MTTDAWSPPAAPTEPEPAGDDSSPGLGLLIDVWLSPREAIRTVVDHGGRYGVAPLGMLMGISWLDFDDAFEQQWPGWAVAALVLVSPLIGLVWLYVEGFLVWLAATALGQAASAREMVAAVAWGRVPSSVMGLPSVGLLLLWYVVGLPEDLGTPLLYAAAGSFALGWCWTWYTTSQTVGEVLRRSAWWGLVVCLLPWVTIGGFFFLVGLALVAGG